jgi:thiol-disulfide isomerase/thioredoxin
MMEKLKEWWRSRWIKNVIFLLALGVLFFTGAGQWVHLKFIQLSLSAPEREPSEFAPAENLFHFAFEIMDESGESDLLSQKMGKPMFVNFWATWCTPCLAEFSSIEELRNQMPELQVICITSENEAVFDKYVSSTSHQLDFYKQLSKTPVQLEHRVIPASFLVGSDGKILFQHFGAANWSDPETVAHLKSLIQ